MDEHGSLARRMAKYKALRSGKGPAEVSVGGTHAKGRTGCR